MARIGKKRYINTRFWEDVYISNLDPIEKLLFLYFITNPHTNISGYYELPLKTIATDTGIDRDMVEKIITRFSDDNKVHHINGWICVMNFSKHQGDSPSIKQGIENAMNDVPDDIIVILQQKQTQSPHSVYTVPPQPDLSISISKSISKSIERERTPADIARDFFELQDDEPLNLYTDRVPEHILRSEVQKFILYWTEPNKSGTRKRWELEKTFDVNRRLATWFSRVKNYQHNTKNRTII